MAFFPPFTLGENPPSPLPLDVVFGSSLRSLPSLLPALSPRRSSPIPPSLHKQKGGWIERTPRLHTPLWSSIATCRVRSHE